MSEAPAAVRNASRLTSLFGYWPSFHDAEVHRLEFDRGSATGRPSANLVVHVFDSDGSVDEKGYYRIRVTVLATIRFSDVADVDLHAFGVQNVLSELGFDPAADGRTSLVLGECYGVHGSFTFATAEVTDVRPWPAPTEDAPPVNPTISKPPSNER
jgi:hypothetical protein